MATPPAPAPIRAPMTPARATPAQPATLGTRQASPAPTPVPRLAPEAKAVPKWVKVMRWIFFVGVWIVLVAIVAQVLLIGRFLFAGSAGALDAHTAIGWITAHNLGPLVLVISAFGRMGWKMHTMAAVAFVLLAITPILAALRYDEAGQIATGTPLEFAALHPVSAITVLTLLILVVLRQRAFVRSPIRTGAPAPAPTDGRMASPPA